MVVNASGWWGPSVAPELDPCSNYTAAWLWLSSMQPTYLSLVSVVGLVGNGLVLCVLCLHRNPCTVADVYLGNLAAADLVMMCCLPFWAVTVAQGYQWNFGELLCQLVNVAISMNYYCSILFLILVSVDRYLALVKPLSSSCLRRRGCAKGICLVIWALGFLMALPALLFRRVVYLDDPGVDACILVYPHPAWVVHYNSASNVLCFLVPVLVMSYCTRHIVAALKDGRVSGIPRVRAERKATYLVLVVLAVFLFCWTPHQLMRFLDTLDYFHITPGCLWGHILDISMQLSTYLAYSNSAINPFLYVVVGKHFRRRAKEVFSKTLKHRTSHTVTITSVFRLNELQHNSLEKLEKLGFKPNASRQLLKSF
ncbi:B2 bradykinin receptor-like [Thalassophryne amazonica]|uniref:B2 bradykinin receptor-like n=1 Tax=Thalassophryne amazonica TaxID=390379 RepID=UPI0014710237|nr:B2 bradykinin receptor-like [Thalassophryne amazonica]